MQMPRGMDDLVKSQSKIVRVGHAERLQPSRLMATLRSLSGKQYLGRIVEMHLGTSVIPV